MEVKKFKKFYENLDYKADLEIKKLKNLVKSFFEKDVEAADMTLSDIDAELDSINTNDWTSTHKNLIVKFSTPKDHFSMLIKVDIYENNNNNEDEEELPEEVFLKIKKLNSDFELIGSAERNIKIEEITGDVIMEMILEIEAEFETPDDDLGLELEE